MGKTSAGTERWGPSGAGIWSAPTIDAARRLVYVSTGNMYTEPQQITSDAVIAMDLDTGKIRWVSQRLPKDVWIVGCPPAGNNCAANAADIGPDYDLGDSPMLAKLPSGKDAIVVGQKSGQGWALDPDKKGAVLWEYRAGRGTTLGGIEWGPAVDEQNAYFAVSDFALENPGGLHAVNLVTGQRAWLTPAPRPICTGPSPACGGAQSAAVTVIPGVVFSGSADGGLRAYSTTDGKIVWTFDANREFQTVNGVKGNGASFGGPGPVIVGGMLFTNSGYGPLGGRPGNVLLAFGAE
jgi:polyvinyl alcohol dehydrogenase (cytochrome)